jgi:hypothetical protein
MWSPDGFEEGLCHVTLYGTVRFAHRTPLKLRGASGTVQIPGFRIFTADCTVRYGTVR